MKPRKIKWQDARSDPSWKSLKEIKEFADESRKQTCTTYGHITYEDEHGIVVSAEHDDEKEKNYGNHTRIPKQLIKKQ